MKLPNAAQATMDPRKITHYLLVPDHPDNGGKAKFFTDRGFNQNNVADFQAALLAHPVNNEVHKTMKSAVGTKYIVHCNLKTPDGKDPCIRTIWIDDGGGPPRLVSAYPFM
jgi:hypothetical protein